LHLHFKFANAELATEICSITNQIFEELNIPDTLKRGILTPVLKKKKDKTLPGNYRELVLPLLLLLVEFSPYWLLLLL
jgi:hypothetical protein